MGYWWVGGGRGTEVLVDDEGGVKVVDDILMKREGGREGGRSRSWGGVQDGRLAEAVSEEGVDGFLLMVCIEEFGDN